MPTPSPRLKRFRRADPARGETLPPFDLQPRDREILKVIADLRLATAETIGQLLDPITLSPGQAMALDRARAGYTHWLQAEAAAGRRTMHPSTAPVQHDIRKRLRRLYHHGYVHRYKMSNNRPIVYGLAPRAVPELTRVFGIDHDRALHQTREDKAGLYFIEHTLAIGRFRAALAQALTHHEAALAAWEPDGVFRTRVVTTTSTGDKEEMPLIPDALFALFHAGELHHFFLEIDRGTMTPKRIYDKLNAYRAFFTKGLHHERHIDHFRVLTVSPAASRTDILRATAATLPSHQGLFWFTTETAYLDTPPKLLAYTWQTAKNDAWRALLEPRKLPRRLLAEAQQEPLVSIPLPPGMAVAGK